MSSESGSDTSSIFRPVSYTSLRNLRHKLSNLFTPPHRHEAAERPLSTSYSLGTSHSMPKRVGGDQLTPAAASAMRTTATTAERFLVDETLEPTQQLSQILFAKIPQLPKSPPTKSTTHSGVKSDDSTKTQSQVEKIYAYRGPIAPGRTANSCFDRNRQKQFKEYIRGAMGRKKAYYGYRSTFFEHRSSKTELDAADCVLTNIINPVLEICQGWVGQGYKLIVSSQAYEIPDGGVGGYIDHGIFLVREDCQSLSKGVDKVIVDRLPSSNLEWMAVVVIEEKVFGTIQHKSWNQKDWEKQLATPIRRSRKNTKQYQRTGLLLAELNSIVKSILPQLRKYSDNFRCENIMLTDYHTSVAISIAPSNADRFSPARLPIEVANCTTMKSWYGSDSPLGDIFEYGPRLTFAYLVWHTLTTRQGLRSSSDLNKRQKR